MSDFNLYDRIVSASIINIVNESDANGIVLPNFKGTKTDKYFLEIAKIATQTVALNKNIYLEINLFKYLFFKIRYRKATKGIKRYNNGLNFIKIPLNELKIFMAKEFDVDLSIYEKIYEQYYATIYGE